MARLTRAQAQERNRAKVLAAARAEFAERGFRDAKVDAIAERAELTRGAVYSNFPGKRALYFAVLADLAENASRPPGARPGATAKDSVASFARAWVSRLDEPPLGRDLLPEVMADERLRAAFTQLMRLDAVLLSLAWEALEPPPSPPGAPPVRLVRAAGAVLTTLQGATQLAAAAPGFAEPFDVISACERLTTLELNDFWAPPPLREPSRADEPWPAAERVDAVTGEPVRVDGVIAVLGPHRLAAVEEAVRAGAEVTAVLVADEPAEFLPLARWAVAETAHCLRQAFPRTAWPRLRVVFDDDGRLAAAAGVMPGDDTETAFLAVGGRIVARADGASACDAVATEASGLLRSGHGRAARDLRG
ncbi:MULTISPECIES: TetR family transcriptional regulator [Amycolatopsis]|uniref:DNA-binding transcriptional regulator, AcrR family n=2 Tax=Amycolatopsis TaxID=1813 RepID=A0A1I3KG42_9PSEU|nr:TetR family transcriptional regulator [Amycolatopsis sacchari]SFI71491.1 DNA-binding transcriptional regulator, AcrR family [Amycolatopsis sacchari]